MGKRLTKSMRSYWEAFGPKRFTRSDLWRKFQGRYIFSGGEDTWPRDGFMDWLALERKPWVVPTPGPRGGEG